MTTHRSKVAVCVPTLGRPAEIRRLLENLLEQRLAPDVVLVVDASPEEATAEACEAMSSRFESDVLRHIKAPRGLTVQRHVGLQLLREAGDIEYVCMLDDDVWLDPAFLEEAIRFMGSEEGRSFGGVSGYDLENWGQPFNVLERFYRRIGLYEGELRPGRWLRCGKFLALSRLEPGDGIHRSDFLPGNQSVWRLEALEGLTPPLAFAGYAQSEDKHLSLRVGTRSSLGVLGSALMRHYKAEGGDRWGPMKKGFKRVRHQAIMLKDCDPKPTARRYLWFLAVRLVDSPLRVGLAVVRLNWKALPARLASTAGWLSCIFWPPRRTEQALTPTPLRRAEQTSTRIESPRPTRPGPHL